MGECPRADYFESVILICTAFLSRDQPAPCITKVMTRWWHLGLLLASALLFSSGSGLTHRDEAALSAIFLAWQPQLERIGWSMHVEKACLESPIVQTTFRGLVCVDGRPWSLNLANMGLTSPIPAQLASLDSLRLLYLGHNQIRGTIPPAVFQMSSLFIADFGHNQLTGTLPNQFSPSLLLLTLEYNFDLQGPLPASLFNLSSIQGLHLANCSFDGPIPTEFGPNLGYIDVSNNSLTGPLPKAIGGMPNHFSNPPNFDASHNYLSGDIPEEIFYGDKGLRLNLADNRLTVCSKGMTKIHSGSQDRFICIIGEQWVPRTESSDCSCHNNYPLECRSSILPCPPCLGNRPTERFHCGANKQSWFITEDLSISTSLTIDSEHVVIFGNFILNHGAELLFQGQDASLIVTKVASLNGHVVLSLSNQDVRAMKAKGTSERALLSTNVDGGVPLTSSWSVQGEGCGFKINSISAESVVYGVEITYHNQPWIICPSWHIVALILPLLTLLLSSIVVYCYTTRWICLRRLLQVPIEAPPVSSDDEDGTSDSFYHSDGEIGESKPLMGIARRGYVHGRSVQGEAYDEPAYQFTDTEPESEDF